MLRRPIIEPLRADLVGGTTAEGAESLAVGHVHANIGRVHCHRTPGADASAECHVHSECTDLRTECRRRGYRPNALLCDPSAHCLPSDALSKAALDGRETERRLGGDLLRRQRNAAADSFRAIFCGWRFLGVVRRPLRRSPKITQCAARRELLRAGAGITAGNDVRSRLHRRASLSDSA
jgi:hypothetical protein